jgi:transposase
MLTVETIRKIRNAHHRDHKSIREIARDLNLSRNTVRNILRSDVTELHYERTVQPMPKLEAFKGALTKMLEDEARKPKRQRRSALLLFEQLQREGFAGGYDAVRRFVQRWKQQAQEPVKAFVPLSFAPGEAFQFDWGYEQIELGGCNVKVKIAQFRLCHSRAPFCVAYLRESLEMVMDAHVQAFGFYGGACRRGIYDNLKTVVSKVLVGKDRVFNRRFQMLASHYLFEPVACTPAAGWEKGQIERQVGFVRQRLFAKRRKFADLEELNTWLRDECRALAASQKHPEFTDQTVAEVLERERESLVNVRVDFDGYQETAARVTPMGLVSFDRNRYSVHGSAVGRTVMVRAYATWIKVIHNGKVVACHRRQFGRDKTLFDPWHYLDVLKSKPGALRNGTPFQGWDLPDALQQVKNVLFKRSDGDRQFVAILASVPAYGLDAVGAACATALRQNSVSRDVILNLLSRSNEEPATESCPAPSHLPPLRLLPTADCQRYDRLLMGGHRAS